MISDCKRKANPSQSHLHGDTELKATDHVHTRYVLIRAELSTGSYAYAYVPGRASF